MEFEINAVDCDRKTAMPPKTIYRLIILAGVGLIQFGCCSTPQRPSRRTDGHPKPPLAAALFEHVLAGDLGGLESQLESVLDQQSGGNRTIGTVLFMMRIQIDLDRDKAILLGQDDKLPREAASRARRVEAAAGLIRDKLIRQGKILGVERSGDLMPRLNLVRTLILAKESDVALKMIKRISDGFPEESDLNQRNIIHHLAGAQYAYALQFELKAVNENRSQSLDKAMANYGKLVVMIGGQTEMFTDSLWSRIWWHSWLRILRIAVWRSADPQLLQTRLDTLRQFGGRLDRHGLGPSFAVFEKLIQKDPVAGDRPSRRSKPGDGQEGLADDPNSPF